MDGHCFYAHRQKVISLLKEHRLGHSVILMRSGHEQKEPFSDGDLPFYQEALFFWLTGWKEPDSALVVDVLANRSILLMPNYSDDYEIWTGSIPSYTSVLEQTGVDEIATMENLDSVLDEITKSSHPVHRFLGYPEDPCLRCDDIHTFLSITGIARKVKFDWEIDCLRKASVLTSNALIEVMKKARPGIKEQHLEAEFLHYGLINNTEGACFPTIVASGENAAFIHYSKNSSIIADGSLILLDCGFFYNHYSGDVSRTFPANGKFSDIQKRMYNSVLKLQYGLIDLVKPGMRIGKLETVALKWIFEILREYGIVKPDAEFDFNIACFFLPHGVSHHIGCNNHDPCMNDGKGKITPKDEDLLDKGMIISIEPGIYFNKLCIERAYKEHSSINIELAQLYSNLISGIRIEDDVLVTENGCEVLSTCPKTVEEIEAIMAH